MTTKNLSCFYFFNDTATTEIYTLSLHDALPIYSVRPHPRADDAVLGRGGVPHCGPRPRHPASPRQPALRPAGARVDRKSTRLNSSHSQISYAVFCLKKKTTSTRLRYELTV